MMAKHKGLTYTVIEAHPAGTEFGPARARRVTYEGFGTYQPKHDFMVIAVVGGESELWSVDAAQRPDGSSYPSPSGLAALRRYYLHARDEGPEDIVVYGRVWPQTAL